METATKIGIHAAKTASKRVTQKAAEATGDLIGNKIADKITSVANSKEKEKTKKVEESRRNLHTTRKKTANYWWLKIFLSIEIISLYKNKISKNCRLAWHYFC